MEPSSTSQNLFNELLFWTPNVSTTRLVSLFGPFCPHFEWSVQVMLMDMGQSLDRRQSRSLCTFIRLSFQLPGSRFLHVECMHMPVSLQPFAVAHPSRPLPRNKINSGLWRMALGLRELGQNTRLGVSKRSHVCSSMVPKDRGFDGCPCPGMHTSAPSRMHIS